MNAQTAATVWLMLALLGGCSADAPDNSVSVGDPPEIPETPAIEPIVNQLVDRFEAKACLKASPVASMRKTSPEGVFVVRAYSAKPDCLEELYAAFDTLGFAEKEPGLYHGASADGTTERVSVQLADDGSGGGIEWEIDQK